MNKAIKNSKGTILQETFDDAVKENIVIFSMKPDEAKLETIKQFKAQGVDLVNIVKDLEINKDTGVPIINETVDQLKLYVIDAVPEEKGKNLFELLSILDKHCQKSVAHRLLASKIGAHTVLSSILIKETKNILENCENIDSEIVEAILKCMNSITRKNPEIFDDDALILAMQLLSVDVKEKIICLTLQWIQKASITHELNRQNIMEARIVEQLKAFILKSTEKILKETLILIRCLILDDDTTVEIGHGHIHARILGNELICDLAFLIKDTYNDKSLLGDILLTTALLAVRQEYCKTVSKFGRIKSILAVLNAYPNDERINREGLRLLRALTGDDSVKLLIVEDGAAPIIRRILETHMDNEDVVSAALGCIATLTLRSNKNSQEMYNVGAPEMIVQALRVHPHNKHVQRNGAWAIRNMVSRSRDQCELWLSYGVEDLLNAALVEHLDAKYDIKSALRDLGCKVEFIEEWTGIPEKKIINDNV